MCDGTPDGISVQWTGGHRGSGGFRRFCYWESAGAELEQVVMAFDLGAISQFLAPAGSVQHVPEHVRQLREF